MTGSALGKALEARFPAPAEWIVPTIVQLELSRWMHREVGEDEADQVIAFSEKCLVASLDRAIALLAAAFHREFRLATADAIVYATAQHHGALLLTCDAHFKGLPGVAYCSTRR